MTEYSSMLNGQIIQSRSRAATNLKVGGGTRPAQSAWKTFCRALHFLALQVLYNRFGERFRDGQYSLVSFLFAVCPFTVPPHAKPFVKVRARAPVPYGVGAGVS